jgi:hypothetical protein
MDELFWGRDHEDVNDWAKRLTMAVEVRDFNDDKLFKIAKLNLHNRAKEWFKKLNPPPADWTILRNAIVQKMKFLSNLMQSNKNPESGLETILKGWINFFRKGRSKMLSRGKGF